VLPGNKVQVTGYYRGNDWAADAIVAVYRPNGDLLGQRGVMDEKGNYAFSYQHAEDLKVVVTHDGHSQTVNITGKELSEAAAPLAIEGPGSRFTPVEEFPLWQIVAGLSLVLALAAFYLSLRTAQRLRELQRLTTPTITPAPPATGTPRPMELPTGPAPG
jgi:hypothetical protein